MSEDVQAHGPRITAVEQDVSGIKTDMATIKTQMRGFGDILQRIEHGVAEAQKRFDDDKQASKINPVAFATIMVTIISILVGGSWLVSGGLATTATRLDDQQRQMSQMVDMRNRELDGIQKRLDRVEMARGLTQSSP